MKDKIRHWRDVLTDHDSTDEQDLEAAAYRLVTEQVLYDSEPRQRTHYRLVKQYAAHFRQVCELLGMELHVNDNPAYCAARPLSASTIRLTLTETLVALVLRKIYHLHRQAGEDQAGHVFVPLAEFADIYQESTGRTPPMDKRQMLERHIDRMRQFGVAKRCQADSQDDQPFGIEILPGIEFLLNERVLAQLQEHAAAQGAHAHEPTDESGMSDEASDRDDESHDGVIREANDETT